MPIFYRETKIKSQKNGELSYRRLWDGTWMVKVPQGEYYSGNSLEKMWRRTSEKYVQGSPKKILILGCGACCAVDSVLRLWPKAEVTALDYDPAIVDIGKAIYKNFTGHKVNLLIEDAKIFIAGTGGKYDLILVDIFYGNRPAAILKDEDFLKKLRDRVGTEGTIIVNLATSLGGDDPQIFTAWQKIFPESSPIKYYGNKLSVYVNKNIPDDYIDFSQSKEYAESLKKNGLFSVGKPGKYIYAQAFPLGLGVISAIHTDQEPNLEEIKKVAGIKHGVMLWSPWRRPYIGRPWRKNILPAIHPAGNGLAMVDKDYQKRWSQTARRDLNRSVESGIKIRDVGAKDFINALKTSALKRSVKAMFDRMISRFQEYNIKYWLAENSGKTVGGLAVLDYDDSSAHLAAFTNGNDKTGAGTLLIDQWYKHALGKGIRYLNFCNLKQSGEPRAWRGFSDFKKKFIDLEIKTTNQYFRFF